MTLSGKYQQYEYPGLEPKTNGISNFGEEDSPSEECNQFSEVYTHANLYMSCLFLVCGQKICVAGTPTKQV